MQQAQRGQTSRGSAGQIGMHRGGVASCHDHTIRGYVPGTSAEIMSDLGKTWQHCDHDMQ